MLKEIAHKLRKLREPLKLNHREMAERLRLDKSTYTRYENADNAPSFTTLRKLGTEFGISLDWFVLNRGLKYYAEIEKKLKEAEEAKKEPNPLANLPGDGKDLLDHMERIPTLRYEVLLFFHRYKEEHKDKVEEAMKEKK
jgi:transcriptional regulator with XRE-family HTH domain